MSASNLPIIQSQLNFYGYTLSLVLGNIGNLLIVLVFSQQRRNACSIYLISLAIANDLYLTFNGLVQLFPFSYGDDASVRSLALCKIRFYVSNMLGQIAKTMIILTCLDRFLFTSRRATLRAVSVPKRAKALIFATIVFWPLFASHIAIFTTVINKQCGTFGTYSTVDTMYTLLFVGALPPAILGVVGYLTYRNMRHIYRRVQPGPSDGKRSHVRIHRHDRDLFLIVICEVLAYVFSTSFYPLILLEMMITRYAMTSKTVLHSQIESFVFTISFLLLFINNAAPFYIYLVVSKPFRRDLKQLLLNLGRRLTGQPAMQPISGPTDATLTKREHPE